MMVVMVMRPDADINTSAMMMVMVMVMMVSDYLSGLGGATLRQTLIVGFQQRQGVRDRIEKISIIGSLREFRTPRRRRLGSSHRGKGCGCSQQAVMTRHVSRHTADHGTFDTAFRVSRNHRHGDSHGESHAA